MKLLPLFLCVALAAPTGALGARPTVQAPKIFPFPIERSSLPNGLTVLLVPFDSPGLAAYYTLVRVGSRNEIEPGRSGFAHFFEHMMFRGTERHPKEDYDRLLSRAGVTNNAFTTDDFTAYHAFGPSEQLPLVVDLESDRFQNLSYSPDDFRTEARAVLGEYHKNFSDPTEKMEEALRDTAFTAHTYKHTTMGFKRDIEAMPGMYDYSREFFRRWYTPDNTTLLVVGDFDRVALADLIRQKYGAWKGSAAKLRVPVEPRQPKKRSVRLSWENLTQPRIAWGWRSPAARVETPDAALQNVLGPYLFGPTSPTWRDLVLERQLVTSLSVSYYDHRDPFLFSLLGTLKNDQAFDEVRAAVQKALADLRAGKVDAKRLADVKSNQKYSLLGSLVTAEQVALNLVFAIGPTGNPDALDALFAQMDLVTAQDLSRFANAWLIDSNLTEVFLTGPGSKPPPGVPEYAPARPAAVKGGAP